VTEQASAGQYLVPVRRCGLANIEPARVAGLVDRLGEGDGLVSYQETWFRAADCSEIVRAISMTYPLVFPENGR